MILSLLFSSLVLCTAFGIGYAVRRGGICSVAAARQSILRRHHVRLRAFLITACWAGAIVLPLAWMAPEVVHLSPAYPVTPLVLLGGALYGVGAYFNGACAFGTLGHLAGGDTNFLGTLAGAFAGALTASLVGAGQQQMHASPLLEPGPFPLLIWLTFVSVAIVACLKRVRRQRRLVTAVDLRNWRLDTGAALLIIGVGGGLLYAVAGKWTYMSIISHRAAALVVHDGSSLGMAATLSALAALAGAVFAALRAGHFRLMSPRPLPAAMKLLGGAAMGFGAAIIPGGNDVMLLYGVPSAAGHAIAAYAAMMAALCALFAIKARLRRKSRCG